LLASKVVAAVARRKAEAAALKTAEEVERRELWDMLKNSRAAAVLIQAVWRGCACRLKQSEQLPGPARGV
jgi:hypothetical protein